MDLLEEKPLVENVEDGKDVSFDKLELNNVDFSYGKEEVLENFNLDINRGGILGISGKSGCGKSTILKLMMRFYDPDKGEILKNDVNLKDINTKNLRKTQTYINQDTYLFKGIILDNIIIGKENASLDEVKIACKKASIHDFISDLDKGYDTRVDDIGNSLSTGERQRISLARGFLKNPSLLLLDEPTANIDSLNESVVLKSILKESKDKSVVLVSHKDSTLRIAGRIIRMKRDRKS